MEQQQDNKEGDSNQNNHSQNIQRSQNNLAKQNKSLHKEKNFYVENAFRASKVKPDFGDNTQLNKFPEKLIHSNIHNDDTSSEEEDDENIKHIPRKKDKNKKPSREKSYSEDHYDKDY